MNHLILLCTSISSLFLRSGASIIFLRQKESDSTSNGVPVNSEIRSQCLCFIDLLVIISSRGHDSLKSSILFFRSKKACQSLSPFGSLRHLSEKRKRKNYFIYTFFWTRRYAFIAIYQSINSFVKYLENPKKISTIKRQA